MSYFNPLRTALASYLSPEQVNSIEKAYVYAKAAHGTQMRGSGEPYITHPVAVAQILSGMQLDPESIMAAMLHDVLEDTPVDKAMIADLFGEQVAELVDGVSKLAKMPFGSRAEMQAENFRKMVSAMARDIRVILIKLADRLHNMRTLSGLKPQKRCQVAQETLEIYAPIANRLGMNQFRIEFEELSFAALYPLRYRVLKEAIFRADTSRKKDITQIEQALQASLTAADISFKTVSGKEKHLYSIYKKMRHQHLPLPQVIDLYMFRIVVPTIDDCYRALGVVHNLYKPVPERFKDYIAMPKVNGYQALHTTLFGPFGSPVEVLIRSLEMDQLAEHGIAAHWVYKSNKNNGGDAQVRAREWLKSLLEMQRNTGNSLEFIENVKIDLFPDEVYVFTPLGTIMELPRGATPVDFAYAVHSDIGNACVAAKIDRQLAPLSSVLKNGQTVEVITAPNNRPNPAWLNFVVTGKARSNIRHYLKRQRRDESIGLGERLLAGALAISVKQIPQENLQAVLKKHQYHAIQDLYEDIGLGNQIANVIALQLTSLGVTTTNQLASSQPLSIKGSEGMIVQFADCCRPIPGDDVRGTLIPGKGLFIHIADCKKIRSFLKSNKLISVCWEENIDCDFKVDLEVELVNLRGALAELATSIAQADGNIDNISVTQRNTDYSSVELTVFIHNRVHLAQVLRRARLAKSVQRIMRKRQDK